MKNKITLLLSILFLAFLGFSNKAYAAPTDEILNYDITVSVNDDATLDMTYHIDWKVLESDSLGPVEWVTVGIPNSHYISYDALTDNISDISYSSSDGAIRIDFDDKYYEGEVISFEFKVVQDYMYQVDKFTMGETVYSFTPGWFDGIDVDSLVIKWESDKATSWTPDCLMDGPYLVWDTYLGANETYTISVTYPNDAFGFDMSKTADTDKNSSYDYDYD